MPLATAPASEAARKKDHPTKPAPELPPQSSAGTVDVPELPAFLQRSAAPSRAAAGAALPPPGRNRAPEPAAMLPAGTRQQMEAGFHADFSSVRVHTGPSANRATRALGARAFAAGTDLYFSANQYDPHSSEGRHLLAHELAHVVQQSGGSPTLQADTGIFGPEEAEVEADLAADQIEEEEEAGPLTPVNSAPQLAPQAVALQGEGSEFAISTVFRDEIVTIVIVPDDQTKPYFDGDHAMQQALGDALVEVLNPPGGPIPETPRSIAGARVRALIEQDLQSWIDGNGFPSLTAYLTARAEALRRQKVRVALEAWLGVAPGSIDWNVEIPLIRDDALADLGTSIEKQTQYDALDMFLIILGNEVASEPPVVGAISPPFLSADVFEYANEVVVYDEEFEKLFSEKYLRWYLEQTAQIQFVPDGFDIADYAPRGSDIPEARREELIDQFLDNEAEGLAINVVLDRWTVSKLSPESYLKKMDLSKEKDAIIDHITDVFMKRAVKDRQMASAIREVAAERAQFSLLSTVFLIGGNSEDFNADLPGLLDKHESDLDPEHRAIIHSPYAYYETEFYLGEAVFMILSEVKAGGKVSETLIKNASAIAGKADIPKSLGAFAMALSLVTALANLQKAVAEQGEKARERIAERIRDRWDVLEKAIKERGQHADRFIQDEWIPEIKRVAKARVKANYEEMKKWLDNFGGETENVIGRYRLAAFAMEEVADSLDNGDEKVVALEGERVTKADVPKLRDAIAYLRAKADKLETKKGKEERREELEKAVEAFAKVKSDIDDGTIKPENYGPSVYREARKNLGIGEYEPYTTVGMALRRDVVATNPFKAWAIQRWHYVEKMHESAKNMAIFAGILVLTIATFLLPGITVAFLGALGAGYGVAAAAGLGVSVALAGADIAVGGYLIYQEVQGIKGAQAVLDLARLDPDLEIQGVTVEDAEKALKHAWISLFITIVLSGIGLALLGRAAYKGIRAFRYPHLTALAKSEPAMAAKIVQKAGSSKAGDAIIRHFGGNAAHAWEALAYVNDGKKLLELIAKVKDADLTRRLLIAARTDTNLTALLKRYRDLEKLEVLLGKGAPAELVKLYDLAKSETAVAKLLDTMHVSTATDLLKSGLNSNQAVALFDLGPAAVRNYKALREADPAIQAGVDQLLLLNRSGKFDSAVVDTTLARSAEYMKTFTGTAESDFVTRFASIADAERKLAAARDELWALKNANKPTAHAEAQVKSAAEALGRARVKAPPGSYRTIDLAPEEFALDLTAQKQLFEQAKAVQGRQQALADSVLAKLGITDGSAYSILKRADEVEFTKGVIAKTTERKAYKTLSEMPDIVRGRFNLASEEDVKRVVAELEARGNIHEVVKPRPREGVAGGYPRYHVVVRDPETGMLHEWQIGTEATTRVFEGGKGIKPIEIPPSLTLKEGMHANIHDIEYDIFKTMQESKNPADVALANDLGIPGFRKKVAELAAESGQKGAATADLNKRIEDLHAEASVILKGIVDQRGAAYVEKMFH